MKTLYALIFVILSTSALADVLDITPIGVDEENTATTSAPAPQPIEHAVDFDVDEYNAEPAPAPVINPIDVAEVKVAARGDDTMIEEDAHTAGVTTQASPKIEDRLPTFGLDFSMDDEAPDVELRATVSEPSTELADWE
jgi:hypothetical protein